MQILTPREFSSFKTLARMSQNELHRNLHRILKRVYGADSVQMNEDWLIAVGDIPIAVAAHMDTVFKRPPTEIFYDREENVIWSPQGLGADDRAGVFAILQLISRGYRPHIIFTTDEEYGGIGASRLAALPCPFDDLRYIIELDRQGADDCVFYECDTEGFEGYIEQFGFVTQYGTFTDICELCPAWEVAGVNLSIGYRDEHHSEEILFVSHMLNTISKVEQMLSNPPSHKFDFEWAYGSFRCACHKCGKTGTAYMMTPISDGHGHKFWYCGDCITNDNVEWCESCYDGFTPGVLINGLCPDCISGKKESFKYYGGKGSKLSWY